MNKKLKIYESPEKLLRDDGATGTGTTGSGNSFSWNNALSSFFDNAGGMLNGVAGIVGAANTKNYSATITTDNTNRNLFSWTNGTTVTAIVIGGVAIVVTLILVLRK
jgi:hypothetical protein